MSAASTSRASSHPTGQLPALTVAQLEYLVAVVEAGTWAEAAERLGVTGSALSQGLAQLERRLGVTLFEREGRRRVVRPEAQEVVAYARRVVADTSDLARWAESVRSGSSGSLRVGMIDLAAVHYFGSTLQRFRHRHPEVELHLAVAPSADLIDQLRRGDLSLAVVVEPPRNTGELALSPLLTEDLGLYAPPGVGRQPPARWGPWVTFPGSSHTRQLVAGRLAELGASFEVVAESHQPEVLRGMVALGLGWTVLPVSQAEAEPNPLRPARARPLLQRRLVAARRHRRVEEPAVEGLLDELEAAVGSGGGESR